MGHLAWLMDWFKERCNGEWEHEYGIKIVTLDNPGWRISISIKDTELEYKDFNNLKIERNSSDWMHCFIEKGCFEVACGPRNLEEGILIFRKWVEDKTG